MFRDTNDDIVSLQESFNVVPFSTFGSLYLWRVPYLVRHNHGQCDQILNLSLKIPKISDAFGAFLKNITF